MRIGSLFAGIGGLELGLERAGLGHVAWQCEIDPFARRILAKQWPDALRIADVRKVSPATVPQVEIICGGFPCQDLSVAGKGRGLDGDRSGLWFEFARVIDECQPALVIVENVTHGQSRWLPHVARDLEELGYVPAPIALPAGSLGAPHVRARTFVAADTDGELLRVVKQRRPARSSRGVRHEGKAESRDDGARRHASLASAWSAPPPMGGVGHGVSGGLDGDPFAADRLRVLGNAVVPQVAEAIGRMIVDVLRGALA
jgi:DNA (cytosine-5)-methyltransferase 1